MAGPDSATGDGRGARHKLQIRKKLLLLKSCETRQESGLTFQVHTDMILVFSYEARWGFVFKQPVTAENYLFSYL